MDRQRLQLWESLETPFYFYDLAVLRSTLAALTEAVDKRNYHVHYAVKANSNDRVLQTISKAGLGADCVSGREIQAAVKNGFDQGSLRIPPQLHQGFIYTI